MDDEYKYLKPGEKIIKITHYPDFQAAPIYDPYVALLMLAGTQDLKNIGKNTLPASGHRPENDQIQELQKFEVLFGRDSLISSHFLDPYFPQLSETTLLALAVHIGTKWDKMSEEEPGRIPHEVRDPKTDTIAQQLTQSNGWEWPYYGSVDASVLWLWLLGKVSRRNPAFLNKQYVNKDGETHSIKDALINVLQWVLLRLDRHDGLLAYKKSNPGGLDNQVWKDSSDSFHFADGSLSNAPIASIETQIWTFEALLEATCMLDQIERAKEVNSPLDYIDTLKKRIFTDFVCEDHDGVFLSIGVELSPKAPMRPIDIRSSNMGHLYNSRLISMSDADVRDFSRDMLSSLWTPEMISRAGVRTVSGNDILFRPGSYHNGSVWPWDTCWIAQGLQRHGYVALAQCLARKTLEVCRAFGAYPELVDGSHDEFIFNNRRVEIIDTFGRRNCVEQPPQEIQTWTVAGCIYSQHMLKETQGIQPSDLELQLLSMAQ